MIELANTLLPNLPNDLNWVYGIVYLIEIIAFFMLLLFPFYAIFKPIKKK